MAKVIDKQYSIDQMALAQQGNPLAQANIAKFILDMIALNKGKARWAHFYGQIAQDMHDEALIQCYTAIKRFDPAKSTPYTYFQMIIFRSFCHTTGYAKAKHEKHQAWLESLESEAHSRGKKV